MLWSLFSDIIFYVLLFLSKPSMHVYIFLIDLHETEHSMED